MGGVTIVWRSHRGRVLSNGPRICWRWSCGLARLADRSVGALVRRPPPWGLLSPLVLTKHALECILMRVSECPEGAEAVTKRVVLARSGDLGTSVRRGRIAAQTGVGVSAVAVDVGQDSDR